MSAIWPLRLFGPVFFGRAPVAYFRRLVPAGGVFLASFSRLRFLPLFVDSLRFLVFAALSSRRYLSLSCTSRVGRHSVALPRCVPRFCDFCKWPMRPSGCVSPVSSTRFFKPCCVIVPLASPTFRRCGIFRCRRFVLRPRFSLCGFL